MHRTLARVPPPNNSLLHQRGRLIGGPEATLVTTSNRFDCVRFGHTSAPAEVGSCGVHILGQVIARIRADIGQCGACPGRVIMRRGPSR